ncbi:Sensor histidine kinase YesM [Pseudobutyrivibrio sp. 49]|uniref:sensor histidine kinase n=1 Tax=Pseudobutyrivibrio sp. 49 TaxID=1855344 RepID=UPI000890DCBF|nr:GHKL domain-containing protein [Pseudobutyrivibrio sp. 49]SDH87106.1 Sensor histidine kinase YesM [Pseudobutyrivibrio sp. 49]
MMAAEIIYRFIYTFEDYVSVFLVYLVIMGAKPRIDRSRTLFGILAIITAENLLAIPFDKSLQSLIFLVVSVSNVFFLKGGAKKWIPLFLPTYTITSVIQTVFLVIYSHFLGWQENYMAYTAAVFPVAVVLVICYQSNMSRGKQDEVSYNIWQLFFMNFSCIFLWFILNVVQEYFKYGSSQVIERASALGNVLLVTCILFCLFVLYLGLLERKAKETQRAASERKFLLEVQQEQIDTIIKSEERLHAFKHDLVAHLNALSALAAEGNIEKVSEYCDNLLKDTQSFRRVSYTGNPAIDGVLGQMKALADERGTDLEIQMVVPKEKNIGDYDLCILISNILKNAIEANANGGKISIQSWPFNDNLCIISSNTSDHPLEYENGKLISSKRANKVHGYGMRNIQAVVDKYDGDFQIRSEDDLIIVEAMV